MRRSIVAGTKADLVDDPASAARAMSDEALAVSAVTGEGLEELLARLGEMSKVAQAEEPEATPYVVLRPGRPRFTVTREGAGWRVKGQNVERLLLETDLDDEFQLAKFQKRLVREGIERRLAELGANPGDEVAIGDRVFEFIPDAPAEAGAVDGR
jgi:GTP-binding protein